MIKKIVCLLLLFMLFVLPGCQSNLFPAKEEIDEFQMVQVIGIDRSTENPAETEITVISKMDKGGTTDKGGGGTQEVTILSSSGPTLFDAVRKLKGHSDKIVFFGHVEYFIFGEEAAKDDFAKYFDIILRDSEIRLTPKVFITRGTAKDLINETSSSDKYIVDRLKNIETGDIKLLSNTDQVNILEVASMLNNPGFATIIPALRCDEPKNEKLTGEAPERDIATAGYAVIKDFKLTGYIDDSYSRGYNFLVNKVGSCAVSVKDETGLYVGLEVIDAQTEVETHFNGDQLVGVTYVTHALSNVQEQQSREDIYMDHTTKELATQQSEILKSEMQQIIDFSKQNQIDCTNLGQQIKMRHPLAWEKIKDRWGEIYPALNIDIVVQSEIERTYSIHEPNGYKVGD